MDFGLRRWVRVAGLRVLRATGRDIRIGHHWVPSQKLTVHSFKHKGYWWHGKRREAQTLASVSKLLSPGQLVLDVGAHVGYLTTYFAHLVGPGGRVIAFEPSEENLRYIRANTSQLRNVQVDPRGVSNFIGTATFFVESLTGQNNSLLSDYEVYEKNAANAGFASTKRKVTIPVTTIDDVCCDLNIAPHFVKIDIEGAEIDALKGMRKTLQSARPIVLMELSRYPQQCWELFQECGYTAYDDRLEMIEEDVFASGSEWRGPTNFFFLPE